MNPDNPKPQWPFPPFPRQVPTTSTPDPETSAPRARRPRPKATPKPPRVRRPNNTTNDGLF